MRLQISSGPLAAARRTSHARSSTHTRSGRKVTARVASIFVTPGGDSIDSENLRLGAFRNRPAVVCLNHSVCSCCAATADLQKAVKHSNPFEYPPGFTLFKVKRAKKPEVEANAPIEDIREQEFLSSHKTGSHHISIYTSDFTESVEFYTKGLGLSLSQWRPNGLPYNGAWFNVAAVGGGENALIHLIELPNPHDFSRCSDESYIVHFSIAIKPGTLQDFYARMDAHGFRYYKSVNNRQAAVFCDPNGYRMEVVEVPEASAPRTKRLK